MRNIKKGSWIPFVENLKKNGVDVLGLHVNNRAIPLTRRLVGLTKEIAPKMHVILGGPTSFSAPSTLYEIEGVDAVCLGEAEISLVSYLKLLDAGKHPREHKGFVIMAPDGGMTNGGLSQVVEDLDLLPFPDYSGYNLDLYVAKGSLPTAISRGCIQRCSYCAESPFFGKFRSRSGLSIFNEVKHHIDLLKLPSLNLLFNDSLINGDIKALETFAEMVSESGINVTFGGMAIARREMSIEVLKKLRAGGCKDMSFGIESGSQEVLHMMRKRLHTPMSSSEVLADAKEAGIGTTVFIIVGFPGETERHFYETLEFLRNNIHNIDNLMVNLMLVLKGSFVERHPDKFGLDPERCSGSDYQTLDGANTLDIRKMRQKILYLLFKEKMTLLSEIDDGSFDPVGSIRAIMNRNELESAARIAEASNYIQVLESALAEARAELAVPLKKKLLQYAVKRFKWLFGLNR